MPNNPDNDWTLDTNVLIRANSSRCQARILMEEISRKRAFFCWSSAVAQEYIARGAINLRQGMPPVPVLGLGNPKWVDLWLSKVSMSSLIKTPRVSRLTGGEKEHLIRENVRDFADYRFMELARSSSSKRLVTQEEDYNRGSIKAIQRILEVRCLDYDCALNECKGIE